MDCRKTSAQKFRTRLGFKQYDIILTKEQSVLTKIMSSFEGARYKHNIMFYAIGLNYIFLTRSSYWKLMKIDSATVIMTTK